MIIAQRNNRARYYITRFEGPSQCRSPDVFLAGLIEGCARSIVWCSIVSSFIRRVIKFQKLHHARVSINFYAFNEGAGRASEREREKISAPSINLTIVLKSRQQQWSVVAIRYIETSRECAEKKKKKRAQASCRPNKCFSLFAAPRARACVCVWMQLANSFRSPFFIHFDYAARSDTRVLIKSTEKSPRRIGIRFLFCVLNFLDEKIICRRRGFRLPQPPLDSRLVCSKFPSVPGRSSVFRVFLVARGGKKPSTLSASPQRRK